MAQALASGGAACRLRSAQVISHLRWPSPETSAARAGRAGPRLPLAPPRHRHRQALPRIQPSIPRGSPAYRRAHAGSTSARRRRGAGHAAAASGRRASSRRRWPGPIRHRGGRAGGTPLRYAAGSMPGHVGADDHHGPRRRALDDALHARGRGRRGLARMRATPRGQQRLATPRPEQRPGSSASAGRAPRAAAGPRSPVRAKRVAPATPISRASRVLTRARHRHLGHHHQPAAKRRRTSARRPLCSQSVRRAQSTGFQKAGTRR